MTIELVLSLLNLKGFWFLLCVFIIRGPKTSILFVVIAVVNNDIIITQGDFIEIIVEIRNYFKAINFEEKSLILKKIGGKIFDFSLCLAGVFQVLKIFSHISRVTKASSSVVTFVDDAASAVSKVLKDIAK